MAAIVITGDKQLARTFAALGPQMANKFARQALRRAAKIAKERAQENLRSSPSIVSGDLLKGLKVRAMKRSRVRIGVTVMTTSAEKNKSGFGGFQLEFGTKHVKAEPFLRPSVYDHQSEIRSGFVDDVNEVIAEAAKNAKVLG